MLFRMKTIWFFVFFLFLFTVKSYADDSWLMKCNELEDYTKHHYLRTACTDFFRQQEGYSDYEPRSVHESENLNYDVRQIIRNTKSKRIVIFLANGYYMSKGTITIEDRDIVFVGVKSNTSTQSHIVLSKPPSPTAHPKRPDTKPGAFIRFNSPGRQLMFKNIILSDVNTHMGESAPDSTMPIVKTGLIDITSAQRVIIDNSKLESYYHHDTIYLGCGDDDRGLLTDFRLTNSILKIPAESSHALHFKCQKKEHHYNAQVAFSTFGFNTAPGESSSISTSPSPTLNSTTSSVSTTSLPFIDSIIYVDVEGSVRFSNSPCNRLKYTDKDSIEHKVPLNKMLYVTNIAGFGGLFAVTENNSITGTYFTHEGHARILDDTFGLPEQCPVALDQYNAKKLSSFLPSNALVQSRLGGSPRTSDYTDWKSKYEKQKSYTTVTAVITGVSVVLNFVLAGFVYRYRKMVSPNHQLLSN